MGRDCASLTSHRVDPRAHPSRSWQEIDKKKKKKKGTLGVGNGAVFFASESDKVSLRPRNGSLTAHALSPRRPSSNTPSQPSPT